MDFLQQIEETLLDDRPPSVYDIIMEAPLSQYNNASNNKGNLTSMDKMNSPLEDTTPSDSGVQLLDSESSELMAESITSQLGFDFEPMPVIVSNNSITVDTNCNVTQNPVEEAMTASVLSTFDTTENIVYRRKVRKTPLNTKTSKKRVSFHEDILKNTRTDNIHIEHGFVTYKNGRKQQPQIALSGRYSWCSEGDKRAQGNAAANHGGYDRQNEQRFDNNTDDGRGRRIVYRNACSDVLDYGNSDVYDTNEPQVLQYDNSGVFEYNPKEYGGKTSKVVRDDDNCSSSSSNSSLDSENANYKSSSCDCIGNNNNNNNNNNNFIDENCYFSEPNMQNFNDHERKKSVWNKEIKPKSSCLKKTKYNTHIILEQNLNNKMKKFNVHDMNQLLDNSSKMIIGSLKSLFTMPLTERGVPEGSEDLQGVVECIPESTPEHKNLNGNNFNNINNNINNNNNLNSTTTNDVDSPSPTLKSKPFLSKSLDGSKKNAGVKQFVHNVDEQLRRKTDEQLYAPTRENSAENEMKVEKVLIRQEEQEIDDVISMSESQCESDVIMSEEPKQTFRNKFIINCESTVFEHTGVSYCYESCGSDDSTYKALLTEQQKQEENEVADDDVKNYIGNQFMEKATPMGETAETVGSFVGAPIAKTFSKFLSSFKAISPTDRSANERQQQEELQQQRLKQQQDTDAYFALKLPQKPNKLSIANNSNTQSVQQQHQQGVKKGSLILASNLQNSLDKQGRHLPSPLKKKRQNGNSNLRYGSGSIATSSGVGLGSSELSSLLSPESSSMSLSGGARGGCGRDSKSTILSDDFDDILTITTDADKSDIVIVDYNECNEREVDMTLSATSSIFGNNLLKPPQATASKTSLINRFLRNVTQKKILDTGMRRNNFYAQKLRNEQKLLSSSLFVPGVKPQNTELIDDLNAEIAMEIEMSGVNSPRRELTQIANNNSANDTDDDDNADSELPGCITARFETGIGEISTEIFNGHHAHIFRNANEQLFKVFKLYTGYSHEGHMTPVLVLLTDQALYVADLVRNRLCTKFILLYSDLDVILLGPFGNTVLLCNSERDMQQVLLAGGPYPAAGLVANLELCARRNGAKLPAVGQLNLEHLAPLQSFVREHSCVGLDDMWMYYAVVQLPAGTLGTEGEPLGPHIKGFLMHRRIREPGTPKGSWNPGYFLLKAGVLYMFQDSAQKLPSWAMALAECQGARRAPNTGRPHCFEIILRGELLQLAAPDEFVASEWLQALLQSASGLFEMQEKHKTRGCTLVLTQNHLITLREDFNSPLRQLHIKEKDALPENENIQYDSCEKSKHLMGNFHNTGEMGSLLSSAVSTPTRGTQRSCSSLNSTPTKLSQMSRITCNSNQTTSSSATTSTPTNSTTTTTAALKSNINHDINSLKDNTVGDGKRYANMSSMYGKNSGLEILTCADIKEMTAIKISSHNDTWWCILEFTCQEVRECSDDLVIFFTNCSEMQRFLRLLEQLWQSKNNDLFPITILDEDDVLAEQCTLLYMDINRCWEPLLSAALGFPL